MSTRLLLRAALVASLALVLAGCSDNMNDLRSFVAKARAQKVTKIAAIPQMTPYVPFTYEQNDRRDPFVPAGNDEHAKTPTVAADSTIHPDFNRPRQALEQYPLDALHMVGTLSFNKVQYAMVSAPDGVVHRVTVGDYMGQQFGRVVKITSTQVDLSEIVPNGFGGWERKPTKLALVE